MSGKPGLISYALWLVLLSVFALTLGVDAVNQGKRLLRSELSVASVKSDNLEDRTLSNWKKLSLLVKVGSRTKADKLFAKHGVGKTTSNLFDTNAFGAWFVAVQFAYTKNPAMAKVDMVSSLTARYGDQALAKMLATTEPDKFIREMMAIQQNNWQRDKRTVGSVFKLLKLDKEQDKLLESPILATWIAYATKLDNENPLGDVFSTLKTHYDGKAFATLLLNVKDSDDSAVIADKLEVLLLKSWQQEEKNVVDVYKLLKLDDEGDQFFQDPLVGTLIRYATMVDKKDSFSGVFSLLQARYNDEKLTDMFMAMRSWWPHNVLTEQLEDLLLKKWQREGMTLKDVFKLLKLEEEGDDLFSNKLLSTWVSYVVRVEKDPYTVVLSTLKSTYGEQKLTDIIVQARDNPTMLTLVGELEKVLFKDWVKAKYSVSDAFVRLKLTSEGEEVFESAAFTTWMAYAKEFERTNADEAVVAVLKERFGDDLPRIIAKTKAQIAWDLEDDLNVVLDRLQKLL
ncbi:hypothetical protein P3T76_009858 [Phytophthora citrophthora]|uniref:RxLR effector protein n=1 Tax=Phytophthora citrophthora TaxID=4793 RepID=A0AAD9GEY6_9STRA|nr:hypothetical protein P3T76_009858 [Phytophthora citrophthora]